MSRFGRQMFQFVVVPTLALLAALVVALATSHWAMAEWSRALLLAFATFAFWLVPRLQRDRDG